MKDKTKIVPYFRKSRKEAVIYVRGENKEFQEMACRLYAVDKDYRVTYVTKDINDVHLCDVLLITNPSRISRQATEYYEILKELKDKGIEVELAMDSDSVNDNIDMLLDTLKNK